MDKKRVFFAFTLVLLTMFLINFISAVGVGGECELDAGECDAGLICVDEDVPNDPLNYFGICRDPNANTCSNSYQIILKLSNDTNAHAEVYNGAGNYVTEVCYDELFGQFGLLEFINKRLI